MIRTLTDPDHLNRIANHPEVYRWIGADQRLDLSLVVEKFPVLGTDFCYLIFVPLCPNVWEIHSAALPEGRGAHFRQAVEHALAWMFLRTDAMEIVTRCPFGNLAAVAGARRSGAVKEFATRTADVYRLGIHDWAAKAGGLVEKGRDFHEQLMALGIPADHEDDETHDRYVGLAVAFSEAGNLGKGIALYNRWAVLSDYRPAQLISTHPPVVDIGTARLAIEHGRLRII